jgi:hypothetical protein
MESSFTKGPAGEVASREVASAELASTEVTTAATEVTAAATPPWAKAKSAVAIGAKPMMSAVVAATAVLLRVLRVRLKTR